MCFIFNKMAYPKSGTRDPGLLVGSETRDPKMGLRPETWNPKRGIEWIHVLYAFMSILYVSHYPIIKHIQF